MMNAIQEQSPVELIKSFGWETAGSNTINGREVKFFTNPDHPKKLLKWYSSLKGFMISAKGAMVRNHGLKYSGMKGGSQMFKPFTSVSHLRETLKNLTAENEKW